MSLKTRKSVIVAKKETVYGTDATPDGTNAILTHGLSITPLDGDTVSRERDRPTFGADEEEQSSAFQVAEFDVEWQSSGTAGAAPAYADLLLACQRDETVNAGIDVQYTHNSENTDSVTIKAYLDGQLHTLVGALGDVELRVSSQALPYLHFRFVGLWVDPASAAAPSPTGWANFVKPLPVNNTYTSQLTLWGQALTLKSFTYTQGNDVQHFDNPGEDLVEIVDRKGGGRLSALAVALSTKNFFKDAKENTTGALSLTHGTVAGQICEHTAPNVGLSKPAYGDDSGRMTIESQLVFSPTTANDDESVFIFR